jgi:hypothetical protein
MDVVEERKSHNMFNVRLQLKNFCLIYIFIGCEENMNIGKGYDR